MVEALKIDHIAPNEHTRGATIYPVDTRYEPFRVSDIYMATHAPRAGGYWVRYQDGYESYSPAAAFEEGYTVISHTETLADPGHTGLLLPPPAPPPADPRLGYDDDYSDFRD